MLLALLLAAATSPTPPLAPLARDFNPEAKGTMGVEFVLPGGGAPDVGITYFLADGIAARIDFGLDAVLAPSGTPAVFNIGVGLRFYQLRRGPVALFLSPTLAFGREKITATDAAEFLAFSGAAGVEYYFTDHLSAGGQLGLGLRFANLGASVPAGGTIAPSVTTRLTTATSGLFANIYF
jgi:hypothetical protein